MAERWTICKHCANEGACNPCEPVEVVPAEALEATKEWGKEAWVWLDDALKALGVPTVFDIPDTTPEDRELEAEAALRSIAEDEFPPIIGETGDLTTEDQLRATARAALRPTNNDRSGRNPEEGADRG